MLYTLSYTGLDYIIYLYISIDIETELDGIKADKEERQFIVCYFGSRDPRKRISS